MDSLARRLFFQLAIRKNRIPLWLRWGGQAGQFTGRHGLVHTLVMTFTLIMMPTVTATHSHASSGPTLFLLQCRTRQQSWPRLSTSHLMRWRYFILTLLNKYKKNHFIVYGQKTCSYINILTTFKKLYIPMYISRQRRKYFFLIFLICLYTFVKYVILFLVKESKIHNDFFVLPVNYYFTGVIKL